MSSRLKVTIWTCTLCLLSNTRLSLAGNRGQLALIARLLLHGGDVLLARWRRRPLALHQLQILVDHLHGYRAISDRRGHPLYGAVAHVPAGEDAGHARLQQQRKSLSVPALARQAVVGEIPPGNDVAAFVARDLLGQPLRMRLRPDAAEQPRS